MVGGSWEVAYCLDDARLPVVPFITRIAGALIGEVGAYPVRLAQFTSQPDFSADDC